MQVQGQEVHLCSGGGEGMYEMFSQLSSEHISAPVWIYPLTCAFSLKLQSCFVVSFR